MLNGEQSVATLVKSLREQRGWSQGQLASRAGVEHSTVWRIEAKKIASPGVDIMRKLSTALGVDLSEITGDRPLPRRRAQIFEGVAHVPVMRVRVQASGRPTWDDTRETMIVRAAVADGRPNIRAAVVTGECMVPYVSPGEYVAFDPDATPQNGEMVVITDDDGATMVKWYRIDELGRPFLRAADGTQVRPNGARLEGVVLSEERRALRDPEA
jgi:transcriptional regulator with XRE-family HTH domain